MPHPPRRPLFRSFISFYNLILICIAALLATSVTRAADEDDDEDAVLPGLLAHYEAQVSGRAVSFRRHDALPTFRLANGESPDPRLPPQGWRVIWKGVLAIKSPGKYQFAVRASGPAVIRIDGQEVVALRTFEEPIAEAEGKLVELKFGPRPLEIEFSPHGPAPELRIFWQSEDFPREALPARAVGHLPSQPGSDTDHFFSGRLVVEEHSCIACHVPSAQVAWSATLARRPGPKLSDAGARL